MSTHEVRLPRNGMTAREMADRIGRTPRTVQRWTSEPRAEYERRGRERRRAMVELRKAGKKYQQIADELGVPIGTVMGTLHRARKA